MDWQPLIDRAMEARTHAYTPYSHFQVGACVMTDQGDLVGGCNVENAAYGPTCCAERVAIFAAIAGGARRILALAVASGVAQPSAPCGVCRQVLREFADGDCPILCVNDAGTAWETTLEALLPRSFGPEDLEE